MYKIKTLLDDNVNFSEIYPEKQASVRENTGLDFDLNGIVLFLQKQTNNFTIDNTIAKDLDEAIFKIYEQYKKEKAPEEQEPTPTPTPEDSSEVDGIVAMAMFELSDSEKEAIESMLIIASNPQDILPQIADYDADNDKYIAKDTYDQSSVDFIAEAIKNVIV